jgi:hypothetical protein
MTINNRPFYKLCIVAILAAFYLLLILLSGCYTAHKADKQINKALAHYPGKVAAIARTAFPCTTTQQDTTIAYIDTIIQADCPDNSYFTIHDTLLTKVVKTNTVKVPVKLPQKVITILQKVEDSAKIYLLSGQLSEMTMNRDNETTRANKANKWLLCVIILLLVSIVGNYLQFKRK